MRPRDSIQYHEKRRMSGHKTLRTSFCLFWLTLLVFTSCGIPNPIPADIDRISLSPVDLFLTSSLSFQYTPVSTVPTSGFNLYYYLSDSADEPPEGVKLADLTRCSADALGGGYSTNNPIASLDQSQIDSSTELYGDIIWDDSTYLLSLALYSDLNKEQPISIGGIEGSVNIYSADESSFDQIDTQDKGFIQFYIAYYIQDPSYSPNKAYSNIEYIGFIDVSDME